MDSIMREEFLVVWIEFNYNTNARRIKYLPSTELPEPIYHQFYLEYYTVVISNQSREITYARLRMVPSFVFRLNDSEPTSLVRCDGKPLPKTGDIL